MTAFELDLGLLTPRPLTSSDEGRHFLELLLAYRSLAPEKYGNYEPITQTFGPDSVEKIVQNWVDPFLWSRGKPRVEGNIWLGKNLRHSSIYISASAETKTAEDLLAFGKTAATQLAADFGYINVFSSGDAERPDVQATVMPFRQGITTHDLRKCIPDVPWVLILGAPYLELIDRSNILNAPAFVTEQLSTNAALIQLTSIADSLKNDRVSLESRRAAVKQHLKLFCGTESVAPKFSFNS
jgi:hypothetical protein